jgi:hypothetical protein
MQAEEIGEVLNTEFTRVQENVHKAKIKNPILIAIFLILQYENTYTLYIPFLYPYIK